MRGLAALVAELSPAEVPLVPLGSVAEYAGTRVDGTSLTANTYTGVDNLLADKRGRTTATYGANTDRVTEYRPGDVLLGNIRPYLKKVWLSDRAGGCSGDVLAVRLNAGAQGKVLAEYLYYVLSSDSFFAYNTKHAKGGKMPRGDKEAILAFPVPLPPVAVQAAAVKVLDKFRSLHVLLEGELEARRRQYSHYANLLLASGKNVPRARMGDLATIVRGASPRPIQAFICSAENGVPWIKIGDVPAAGKYVTSTAQHVTAAGAAKSRRVRPGDFVLSNSMSFGRPYISKIDGYIHDGWLAISDFGASFDPDYLYYLLRSAPIQTEFARRAGAGTVKNLNADIVKSIQLPVPTREQQSQVVALLNRFDVLVNDPDFGLPAEMAARRQQFEYYRDKLLAFPGRADKESAA